MTKPKICVINIDKAQIRREENDMLKQVSIYAENKKGTFQNITSL